MAADVKEERGMALSPFQDRIERWYPLDGHTTHRIVRPGEPEMRIDPVIRECSVFLSCQGDDGTCGWVGTAFLVAVPERRIDGLDRYFRYFVTAKHVVLEVEREYGSAPIIVRYNTRSGDFGKVAIRRDMWEFHQADLSVDVAVCPVPSDVNDMAERSISTKMILTEDGIREHEVDVGDVVVVPTLFPKHSGRLHNLTIVRQGTIALMPDEQVEVENYGQIDAYLVEMLSVHGHSGAPAFVHLYPGRMVSNRVEMGGRPPYLLMGLVHGHYSHGSDESGVTTTHNTHRSNDGIGIVIPAWKILEILEQDSLRSCRKRAVDSFNRTILPIPD